MKYLSVDKLSDFEFHDANFALESFADNCLTVRASYLNIHKQTEQNCHKTDMEIDSAIITFEDFRLLSYESGRAWERDENGELYSTEPPILLTGDSAYSCFSEQLEAGLTIFDLGIKEETTYFIDALSKDPFFTVCFTFGKVRISWDAYSGPAWYVSCQ